MKKIVAPAVVMLSALLLLTGCVGLTVGGGSKNTASQPTVGQQLIDLQNARNSGAITETEYQAQKAKVLAAK